MPDTVRGFFLPGIFRKRSMMRKHDEIRNIAIIAHVDESEYQLVEALATAIARICVVDHGAASAIVRVEKPGALRFSRSVGVEIERERADFE